MIVYLAARYSRRDELCTYRIWCERAGIQVTSRWLDGDHQILDGQLLGADDAEVIEGDSQHAEAVALRKRFAREDWEDLKLHEAQTEWAAEQAASFREYLARQGKPYDDVDGVWPVRTADARVAEAAS